MGAHPASLVGGASYEDGRVGRSWVFNGTDGGAVVTNVPDLNSSAIDEITVEGWIRLTAPKSNVVIAEKREGIFGSGAGYKLGISGGRLNFLISDIDNPAVPAEVSASTNQYNYVLHDGRWHHVSASILRTSPSALRLSVDGHFFGPFGLFPNLSAVSNPAP